MLDATQSEVLDERSTGRDPLDDDAVRELLGTARSVTLCRGRKYQVLDPAEVALDDLKGRTGNYRAPMLLVGGTLLVGFNRDALADLLTG